MFYFIFLMVMAVFVIIEVGQRIDWAGIGKAIVDAIFGTGLQREVQGEWRMAIELISSAVALTLALYMPS